MQPDSTSHLGYNHHAIRDDNVALKVSGCMVYGNHVVPVN
jgi:hypothetical protein